ncbi:hypothetical protein GCM10028818_36250 [Spirosoma horti]
MNPHLSVKAEIIQFMKYRVLRLAFNPGIGPRLKANYWNKKLAKLEGSTPIKRGNQSGCLTSPSY